MYIYFSDCKQIQIAVQVQVRVHVDLQIQAQVQAQVQAQTQVPFVRELIPIQVNDGWGQQFQQKQQGILLNKSKTTVASRWGSTNRTSSNDDEHSHGQKHSTYVEGKK